MLLELKPKPVGPLLAAKAEGTSAKTVPARAPAAHRLSLARDMVFSFDGIELNLVEPRRRSVLPSSASIAWRGPRLEVEHKPVDRVSARELVNDAMRSQRASVRFAL